MECVDEEFNSFLSAASLADNKADVPGCKSGRYLSLNPNVFRNVSHVKYEGHTLLPSLELKNRKAVYSSLPGVDMLKHLNLRSRSLLVNWDRAYVWDSKIGLIEDHIGDLAIDLNGLSLADTITKVQLRDELHLRTRVADLAVGLLDHQTKILIAQNAELKIMLRTLFLERFDHSVNQRLSEALAKSRLSSPGLFGEIPEGLAQKIEHSHDFPSFKAPKFVAFSGPPPGKIKKFPGYPSGNRGASNSSRSFKRSSHQRRPWARGGRSQLLSANNVQAGGQAKTSRGSMRTARGKASTRGSKPRGGKGYRGKGRGKKKFQEESEDQ